VAKFTAALLTPSARDNAVSMVWVQLVQVIPAILIAAFPRSFFGAGDVSSDKLTGDPQKRL
jgi:hypothetical protein